MGGFAELEDGWRSARLVWIKGRSAQFWVWSWLGEGKEGGEPGQDGLIIQYRRHTLKESISRKLEPQGTLDFSNICANLLPTGGIENGRSRIMEKQKESPQKPTA